ncbi:MAG: CTP synthase, partial [Candidatus Adlerbacteria bacterium GW2011_GWB1_54_7]
NTLSEHVISAPDVDSIYDVPLNFEKDGMGNMLCDVLSLPRRSSDLSAWEKFVAKSKNGGKQANIAVVGKYFDSGEFVLSDSYISVLEALRHAAYSQDLKISITYFDSKAFESGKTPLEELKKYSGVLVPGGFGETGIEGKLKAIEYVRENKIPYLGLCYGMQLAVIEYARNVAGLAGANTTEVDKDTPHPVIAIMESQKENVEKSRLGGTMRLGAYPCSLADGTVVAQAYDKKEIRERHRHRYEVNPKYIEQLESAGLNFSGRSPDGVLMEIAELPKEKHPFFLGTQFHPEFLSRPLSPHPLFVAFLKAAGERA